jgi:hypothetical protein
LAFVQRLPNPIRLVARLTCVAVLAGSVRIAPAQPLSKPFLRIISPANGAVVRPRQTMMVKVTGAGEYAGIAVLGSEGSAGGINGKPAGRPPWTIPVRLNAEPGKEALMVAGALPSGEEVDSDPIEIDVEPAEIPRVVFSHPPPLLVPRGVCVSFYREESPSCGMGLFVSGIYPDGTEVNLSRSTRWKIVSQDPSIAQVTRDSSALVGQSPGSTKVVFFGKYTLDVTVR